MSGSVSGADPANYYGGATRGQPDAVSADEANRVELAAIDRVMSHLDKVRSPEDTEARAKAIAAAEEVIALGKSARLAAGDEVTAARDAKAEAERAAQARVDEAARALSAAQALISRGEQALDRARFIEPSEIRLLSQAAAVSRAAVEQLQQLREARTKAFTKQASQELKAHSGPGDRPTSEAIAKRAREMAAEQDPAVIAAQRTASRAHAEYRKLDNRLNKAFAARKANGAILDRRDRLASKQQHSANAGLDAIKAQIRERSEGGESAA